MGATRSHASSSASYRSMEARAWPPWSLPPTTYTRPPTVADPCRIRICVIVATSVQRIVLISSRSTRVHAGRPPSARRYLPTRCRRRLVCVVPSSPIPSRSSADAAWYAFAAATSSPISPLSSRFWSSGSVLKASSVQLGRSGKRMLRRSSGSLALRVAGACRTHWSNAQCTSSSQSTASWSLASSSPNWFASSSRKSRLVAATCENWPQTTSEATASSSMHPTCCANTHICKALGRSRSCSNRCTHKSRTAWIPMCSLATRIFSNSSTPFAASSPLYRNRNIDPKAWPSIPCNCTTSSLLSFQPPTSNTRRKSLAAARTTRCALKSWPSTRSVTSHRLWLS
mmetsp:Transcript_53881/g.125905  ORF Transcript_53881/g.125905 Transcript_53881/m.125905 type:complete len:342 (-) Transcript_53881:492-1517(-)